MTKKIILLSGIAYVLLLFACKNECKGVTLNPRFIFPVNYSLAQDTIALGDSIEVSLTYPVDFVSPDRFKPIDLKDFDPLMVFQTFRVDTLINGEFITRHDPGVELIPIEGDITPLSAGFKLTPVLDAEEVNYNLNFYLVFNSKGVYTTSWSSSYDLQWLPGVNVECLDAAVFLFPVEEGQRNHYLIEHIPDDKIREANERHLDDWGIISVVVQ